MLVLTPKSNPEKNVSEQFGQSSRNSMVHGGGGTVERPHIVYAKNNPAQSASLVPVFTRTFPDNACTMCAPCYIASRETFNSINRIHIKSGLSESFNTAVSNRDEGYAIP